MTKKTSKYSIYYNQSKNKEEFIKLLLQHFPKLSLSTANRRWYDYKIQKVNIYSDNEKQHVSELKLLTIKDMIKYKVNLTREYLNKYGYNNAEINWLLDEKYIILNENQ